ncbi:exodeoxyribonuclease VII large subunit [Cellvibrio mixtus]|uniref:Exodeoxyribonuclease 7 large subunit n=1 Tax=Cellvibrio mixtus TaxID=39650 RepID=A0A266Q7R1_9GAMM|nr:exodeoxyribonuclease VII large subunit [Cellvibrio mixtus]OZY85914.1 exodeoxyribonuclease VII large subunit [Cellvibrio mixtus]
MTTTLPPKTTDREIFSVSQLNRQARQLLETHLPLLWVEGELSNVSTPSSGHWYFTLKDDQAQVRCCMFRNRNMLVRFKPQQGQHVLLRARVSLYEGRGDYQIIAEHMEEAGSGALQRAFDELKHKLAQEGLFNEAHKKALPPLPKHIGVITSPTGAAIRDVLSVLERRFPSIPVTVIPVAVQGKESAPQIVKAIELANRCGLFDVLLLTRGGGSMEDLWSFNEEIVARAIFNSALPIVSGVGHEVDFTIADFVADLRAPTPSAAAELLVPDGDDWLDKFIGFEVLLEEAMLRRLQQWQKHLHNLRQRLRHPRERLEQQAQRLDNLELRLKNHLKHLLVDCKNRLQQLQIRQQAHHPQVRLQQLNERIAAYAQRLQKAQYRIIERKKQAHGEAVRLLNTLNPLSTLERGYALVTDPQTQKVITHSDQVMPGTTLNARVAQGEFVCRVESIRK